VMKRAFDIVMAFTTLFLLIPLMIVVAMCIKLDSEGPVLFRQQRVGRGFRPFWIYKFRTMRKSVGQDGSQVTVGNDSRITRVGRFLRQTKLDELPQLINILRGDMSFVGPRPEVPRYVRLFQREYREILTVRPGLTDLASLKYRDEAALLAKADNPEEEYTTRVLPDKINLSKDYIRHSSFLFDLGLILRTILAVFDFRVSSS
jgi:lipopolysaccharide/colanic/teichoic acid biosynthesis glycosyltransferase